MARSDCKRDKMEATRKTLPHELIVEILSWLPIKYLSQFRCVSKTWLGLLTRDPQFSKLHFDRAIQSETNPCIIALREKLCYEKYTNFYLAADHTECDKAIQLHIPFAPKHHSHGCIVCGICNGLLCLSSIYEDEVYIWNPITNDHITIRYPPAPSCFSDTSRTAFGFGFVQSTNEYKVIKIGGECDQVTSQYHTEVRVYTLGVDSSWRIVKEDIQYFFAYLNKPCTLINGVVHWLATKPGPKRCFTILAFALKDEFFHEIEPPNDFQYDGSSALSQIGELGGLLFISNARFNEVIQVWTMDEYGVPSSWTKQFKIERPEVVGKFNYMRPLGVVAHGEDIILQKNSKELIIYNHKANSISSLKDFGLGFRYALAYFGSIISPRVISGAGHIMSEK